MTENEKTKKEEEFTELIETIDEEGNLVKFELFDIVEFENQEYALLLPADNKEDNDEVVLMRLIKEGEEYVFEAIEDDDEFNKVSEYIESMDEEAE